MNALVALHEAGFFSNLDYHFAKLLAQLSPDTPPDVLLAAALASNQTRDGHVCVPLEQFAGTPIVDVENNPIGELCWPDLDGWCSSLRASALVTGGERAAPLVLDSAQRLYLHRYWEHEQRLAELLLYRIHAPLLTADRELARAGLQKLFSPALGQDTWQHLAAQLALVKRLCVITGGPGTGKTSTVVKLLSLVAEQYRARGSKLRVLLLAPTGKAAARLSESIQLARHKLAISTELLSDADTQAQTVHRALRPAQGSLTRFRHGPEDPLHADMVVVDEASMVDVALMRRLLEALPADARLLLLGDRHQLASVQAGSVLGDLCGQHTFAGYSPALARHLEQVTGEALRPEFISDAPALPPIADCVIELVQSYRFAEDSGIAKLAQAIRLGQKNLVLSELLRHNHPDIAIEPSPDATEDRGKLERWAVERYARYLEQPTVARALGELEKVRVLCGERHGKRGALAMNQRIQMALIRRGLVQKTSELYAGRPIIVTQNSYQTGLFNGDIGLLWRDAEHQQSVRAFFFRQDGTLRSVALGELPAHETVFAMSVHKSQGSEFDEVAVVLPEPGSPLLNRELLYTAVTRAKKRVELYTSPSALETAVASTRARSSGLAPRLWSQPDR